MHCSDKTKKQIPSVDEDDISGSFFFVEIIKCSLRL